MRKPSLAMWKFRPPKPTCVHRPAQPWPDYIECRSVQAQALQQPLS